MKPNDYHVSMDVLASLCKRRGFIFQTSEIYGGINGFWDYGPLGVELKRNIKVIKNFGDVPPISCFPEIGRASCRERVLFAV